ncbi:hypothetical protein FQZ97_596800 [compost metagenome]
MRQDEPGRVIQQRPHDVVFDQPGRGPLLGGHVPGAGAPEKGADRDAHQAEAQQRGLPGIAVRDTDDFLFRRTRRQGDRAAIAAAASTDVAIARALHVAQRHQRRAVDGLDADDRMAPLLLVYLEVPGRQLGQQVEHTVDRAHVLAPHPLAAAVAPADDHGGHRGPAQHGQHGQRILVHADELPIDGRQRERHERPAAPADPFRNRKPFAAFAGPLREHALGA